jgi:hypothetical protein
MRPLSRTAPRARIAIVLMLAGLSAPVVAQPDEGARSTAATPKLPIIIYDLVPGGRTPNYSCVTAHEDVDIYDRRGSRKVIARMKWGDAARVEEHELHVWPQVATVVFPHPPYRVGEKFYLLAYEEENYRRVWFRGVIDERYGIAQDAIAAWSEHRCTKPSKTCWLSPGPEGRETWWLKLRLPSGITGWTNQPERLVDRDDSFCAPPVTGKRPTR